jgi:hypothetical protein
MRCWLLLFFGLSMLADLLFVKISGCLAFVRSDPTSWGIPSGIQDDDDSRPSNP